MSFNKILARGFLDLGKMQLDKELHLLAVNNFNISLQFDPYFPFTYYHRGRAWAMLGEYIKAFSDFDEAIRLKSDFVNAYFERGVWKGELGQFTEAISDFTTVIDLSPNWALAHYYRGFAHAMLYNFPAAIRDLDIAILLRSKLGKCLYSSGNGECKILSVFGRVE